MLWRHIHGTETLEGDDLYSILPKLWGDVRTDQNTHTQAVYREQDRADQAAERAACRELSRQTLKTLFYVLQLQ